MRSFQSILADPTPVRVALYFDPQDAPKLWDLAARHYPSADSAEMVSRFAMAARATERGLPIIVEAFDEAQMDEVVAFFPAHGIAAPRVEEVRLG
jgi:hypothetical protein